MSNKCANFISIEGKENELRKFNQLIDDWTSKDFENNGWGTNWLGNILGFSGVAPKKEQFDNIFCRGYLYEKEFVQEADNRFLLKIQTISSWSPCVYMWKLICDKYLSNYKLTFVCEEPGEGVYITNDTELAKKYILYVWDREDFFYEKFNVCTDEECSEDAIVTFCQKLLKTNCSDVEKLLEKLEKSRYKDCITIVKWEYTDIEELEDVL